MDSSSRQRRQEEGTERRSSFGRESLALGIERGIMRSPAALKDEKRVKARLMRRMTKTAKNLPDYVDVMSDARGLQRQKTASSPYLVAQARRRQSVLPAKRDTEPDQRSDEDLVSCLSEDINLKINNDFLIELHQNLLKGRKKRNQSFDIHFSIENNIINRPKNNIQKT